jgi:O-antigen ligase
LHKKNGGPHLRKPPPSKTRTLAVSAALLATALLAALAGLVLAALLTGLILPTLLRLARLVLAALLRIALILLITLRIVLFVRHRDVLQYSEGLNVSATPAQWNNRRVGRRFLVSAAPIMSGGLKSKRKLSRSLTKSRAGPSPSEIFLL